MRREPLRLFLLFAALVVATRLPLAPGQLFSFDDVNFAYAIGDFDLSKSQPHPPGYPLFVLQTRLLFWLGFKRPESNLLALALIGSAAAVFLMARATRGIFGSDASLAAAWLLLFNHSFWYSGLTSAVRPQLAVVSIAVAAACHRAWEGEKRWALWSSLILGLGAGIRPELGVLLLPLWALSVGRGTGWRGRAAAAGILALSVCAWLIPMVADTGGITTYWRLSWAYLEDQAALTSGLFGATDSRWAATITWLVVWTFSGILAWPLPAVLGARRNPGTSASPAFTRDRLAFLLLWFVPAFVFALFVHIADAGQASHLLPVVCLFGGYLISGALDRWQVSISRWFPLAFVILPAGLLFLPYVLPPRLALLLAAPLCLAVGLWLRWPAPAKHVIDRRQAMAFLAAPGICVSAIIFFQPVWYYRGPPSSGLLAVAHQVFAYAHSGLSFSSLEQVRGTAWADDHHLATLGKLDSERPNRTFVVWERGLTSWRKTNYYFARLPVIVFERKKVSGDSPAVATIRRGPEVHQRLEGAPPLRIEVPAGSRLVWMVNPNENFLTLVKKNFEVKFEEPLYYTDLPDDHGERLLNDYLLSW